MAPAGCRGCRVCGEDDSGPASLGWWGALGSLTLCLVHSLPVFASLPILSCSGMTQVSPFRSPGVRPRQKRSPLTPQSPSVSIPPSPAEPFLLAQEAAGKREQQAPQMCHCAKCFQTLQDVTVSQFQFIRWRREDAVTSKLSFSL